MLKLGEQQVLEIARKVSFGFYLTDPNDPSEEVLLPGGQIPDQTPEGTACSVFLYKDSEDRLIATTKEPALVCGQIGVLTVKETAKIGAFLDWGLPKDLFLPFREQTARVEKGRAYPVVLYIDKSGRLCASMKLYDHLENASPYHEDDHVEGHIYEENPQYGYFVAVDDRYSALIPKREVTRRLRVGDFVKTRIKEVREDGRLILSLREKAYLQMGPDADTIFHAVIDGGGSLPLTDHSDPEEIRKALGMSKAAFKRGVGRLLKEGKIELHDEEIVLKRQS